MTLKVKIRHTYRSLLTRLILPRFGNVALPAVLLVLAYGGLRIGEALCLRRRHIDLTDGRVTVAEAVTQLPGGPVIDTPKSHQRRELALPAFVVERLRGHLDGLPDSPDVFLFPGRQQRTAGRPQSYNGWKYRFDQAVKRAGLADVIPHDLRATHGSWVADSHGVLVAARRLGHSNASVTTRHYARAVDGRDAEVAAFLDRARRRDSKTERARNGHAGEVDHDDGAAGPHLPATRQRQGL
ncbi:MAG TPA: site-specific integrase [Micromonosporaceae bacterium]|nr:site-specific integrase [Micromonosporaceae bacterium]